MNPVVLLDLLRNATIELPADDEGAGVAITFHDGLITFNVYREEDTVYGGTFTLTATVLKGIAYAAMMMRQGTDDDQEPSLPADTSYHLA